MSERAGAAASPGGDGPKTLLEVLRRTTEFLAARGCDAPRLSAELLLAKGLGMRRLDLYLHFDRPLLEQELVPCRELVRRAASREPLAYILGEREFWSLTMEVGPGVLVPRPETEALVELTLEALKGRAGDSSPPRIAEIGTGSGCISVAIAHSAPNAQIVATDLSAAALAFAARNAARHGVAERVRCLQCRFLDAVEEKPAFDVLVSNPPYVLPSEESALPPELRYEPREAIFIPGGDAVALYGAIAKAAATRLLPGGACFVEIGEALAATVERCFEAAGLVRVRRVRDLAGLDRVVVGYLPAATN